MHVYLACRVRPRAAGCCSHVAGRSGRCKASRGEIFRVPKGFNRINARDPPVCNLSPEDQGGVTWMSLPSPVSAWGLLFLGVQSRVRKL